MRKQTPRIDKTILILTISLTLLGILAIADVSAPYALNFFSDSFYYAKQQLVWIAIGIFFLIINSFIPFKFWRSVSAILFYTSLIFLVLVLFPAIGSKILGARRWINLGVFSFQPSELVKLTVILYYSALIHSQKKLINFILPMVITCTLIMLQPDLGTTLIIVIISFAAIFISGTNLVYLFGVVVVGAISTFLLTWISEYRRQRFFTFLHESVDPLGSSYHIRQILLALGSGGLFGVGIGQSRQKFLFLPETATDSVFAAIAEELGFIGSAIVILLFAFFIYKIFRVCLMSKDRFASSFTALVAVWIGSQSLLNLGSITAMVPFTGVPMPFLSYGGSALLVLLFSMGIVLNISREARSEKFHGNK